MITVNAMGENCPIPVIKTKKAMRELNGGEIIEVLVDNEIAVQNVSKLGISSGGTVATEQMSDREFKVKIQMGETPGSTKEEEQKSETGCLEHDTIVVVSSDRMGAGNEALGKVLIKGFLYAITQLEAIPGKMLFYNGGATLTTTDSDSLEDLKYLESVGVEILTCGTCLDYYQSKEKLAVGSVTNMYNIVEAMAEAKKVIRP